MDLSEFNYDSRGLGDLLTGDETVKKTTKLRGYCAGTKKKETGDGQYILFMTSSGEKANILLDGELPCINPFIHYTILTKDVDIVKYGFQLHELKECMSCVPRKCEMRTIFAIVLKNMNKELLKLFSGLLERGRFIDSNQKLQCIDVINRSGADRHIQEILFARVNALFIGDILCNIQKISFLPFYPMCELRKLNKEEAEYLYKLMSRMDRDEKEKIFKLWISPSIKDDEISPIALAGKLLRNMKRRYYKYGTSSLKITSNKSTLKILDLLHDMKLVVKSKSHLHYVLCYEKYIETATDSLMRRISMNSPINRARILEDDIESNKGNIELLAILKQLQRSSKVTVYYGIMQHLEATISFFKSKRTSCFVYEPRKYHEKLVYPSQAQLERLERSKTLVIDDISSMRQIELYKLLTRASSINAIVIYCRAEGVDYGCYKYCYQFAPNNTRIYLQWKFMPLITRYGRFSGGYDSSASICMLKWFDYDAFASYLRSIYIKWTEVQTYALDSITCRVINERAYVCPNRILDGRIMDCMAHYTDPTLDLSERLAHKGSIGFLKCSNDGNYPLYVDERGEYVLKREYNSRDYIAINGLDYGILPVEMDDDIEMDDVEEAKKEDEEDEELIEDEKHAEEDIYRVKPSFCMDLKVVRYRVKRISVIHCDKNWKMQHLKEVADRTSDQLIICGDGGTFARIYKRLNTFLQSK